MKHRIVETDLDALTQEIIFNLVVVQDVLIEQGLATRDEFSRRLAGYKALFDQARGKGGRR